MEPKLYFVYILASKRNGTLYIGMTNNLLKRIDQHKNDLVEGFTEKYGVHRLVYYEQFHHVEDAINREKQLKKWNRHWKLELIEKQNPQWRDLFEELVESRPYA
jgi:putative endonuclease